MNRALLSYTVLTQHYSAVVAGGSSLDYGVLHCTVYAAACVVE